MNILYKYVKQGIRNTRLGVIKGFKLSHKPDFKQKETGLMIRLSIMFSR